MLPHSAQFTPFCAVQCCFVAQAAAIEAISAQLIKCTAPEAQAYRRHQARRHQPFAMTCAGR
eukprot:1664793-Pleurochrysis_carterae.AAC.2